ncbi:MAG: hypothetical protein ACM3NH_02220 [Candidatus Saccharibacteria bacterium]
MARFRRLSRNQTLGALAGLVIVLFLFFWVVKPWLWGKPAKSVVQTWSWPGARPAGAVAAKPVALTAEQAYADFRVLAFKTAENNGQLINQNTELVKSLAAADNERVALAKDNARLDGENKSVRASNRILRTRATTFRRQAAKAVAYPVASSIEYVGCPCPGVR